MSAAEQYLKLELTKNFKVGITFPIVRCCFSPYFPSQVIRDLELMPQLLGSDWSSVFLQRFAGSVTILPKSRILVSITRDVSLHIKTEQLAIIQDWFRLLRDPDRKELDRMMRVGQQVAWPTVSWVEVVLTVR